MPADVGGALNAGCNVHAIELDHRHFIHVRDTMSMFNPKSDLSMVVTPAHLAFGIGYLEHLGPYRHAEADTGFVCTGCEKDWPGSGFECESCSTAFCHLCLPGEVSKCQKCIVAPEEPPEKPVEPPTLAGQEFGDGSSN